MSTYAIQFRNFASTVRRKRVFDLLWLRVGMLLIGTLLWFATYSTLMRRLIQEIPTSDQLNLSLGFFSIALGVLLTVFWWREWQRWRGRGAFGGFAALNLDQLQRLTPSQFEEYVTQRVFARRGFHAFNTPDVKDGGVDILVTNEHGEKAVVQCKRYRNVVGAETVRDLYGTMLHAGAAEAYLVTTARISQAAREWARGKNIALVDGDDLVELAR